MVIFGERSNAADDKVPYIANETSVKLSKLIHEGKVKPSLELKGALMRLSGDWLASRMEGFGFSHRLKDHMESWIFLEDREYIIILGTVKQKEEVGYFFVWVLTLSSEHLDSVYLCVANKTLDGRQYPKGVIPYSSVWDKVRDFEVASIWNAFKKPQGVYSASWIIRGLWKKVDYDFRDNGTVTLTETTWIEGPSGGRIAIRQSRFGGNWSNSRGVVKAMITREGVEEESNFRLQGDDLIGDKSVEERRFKREK